MMRVLAGWLTVCALLTAQEAPDLDALADRLWPRDEAAPGLAEHVPADAAEQARALVASMTEEERRLLRDAGSPAQTASRALAIATLLEHDGRPPADAPGLVAELEACRLLSGVAVNDRMMRNATTLGGGPAWVRELGPHARRRAAALLAALLRDHRDQVPTLRALVHGGLGAAEDGAVDADAEFAACAWAYDRLGARARGRDHVAHAATMLRRRHVPAARTALAAARAAAAEDRSTSVEAREALADQVDALTQQAERLAALEARVAAGETGPLLELELRCATSADDVEGRCRALVDQGFDHALPYAVLSLRALGAGRRDEAAALAETARTKPGRDAGLAVVLVMLALPRLQELSQRPEDDDAAALEIATILAEFDEVLAADPSPEFELFRVMREVGWPMTSQREVTRALARTYGGDRAPRTTQAHALALAGVMAGVDEDGDFGGALRFLATPPPARLAWRPLLLRQRAAAATSVLVQAAVSPDVTPDVVARARAVAAAARAASRSAGDEAYAGYLAAVEAWFDASDEAKQRAVLARLDEVTMPAVLQGAWTVDSAPLVLSAALDGAFDRERLVRLRAVAGVGSRPAALVPLAVAGLVAAPGEARGLVEFLRPRVEADLMGAVLLVGEVEAARRAGNAARAGGFARQVLDREDWNERRARMLARGVWLQHELRWGVGFTSRGHSVEVHLRCEPLVVPKLEAATSLRRLARER